MEPIYFLKTSLDKRKKNLLLSIPYYNHTNGIFNFETQYHGTLKNWQIIKLGKKIIGFFILSPYEWYQHHLDHLNFKKRWILCYKGEEHTLCWKNNKLYFKSREVYLAFEDYKFIKCFGGDYLIVENYKNKLPPFHKM